MKRFSSSIGITLLALLVSGWGNVLASALCPHAIGGHQQTIAESRTSCHSRTQTAEHQPAVSSHHVTGGFTTAPSAAGAHVEAIAMDQPRGSCSHCFGPKESSTTLTIAHGLLLKKQDSAVAVERPIVSAYKFTEGFTPQSSPTQHGPPRSANRKHLLLGVFLI